MNGPLSALKVLEMSAIGPVPWCGMVLAELGADVLRVDRPDAPARDDPRDFTRRGRISIPLDLKREEGVRSALALARCADVLLEGLRPGAMERLGLGPRECHAANPRLVYARMTGWGQGGPLARRAGHDINYLALTGALHAIGRADSPVPPLNLVADYGGGGAFLAIGLLAAVLESRASGRGQVVDVAMVDGVAKLMALPYGRLATGHWRDERRQNALDGGAPWYDVYETADGRHVAVGAIEPQFYALLLEGLGLDARSLPDRAERRNWPALRAAFAAAFRTRTRDEWAAHFAATDACVTPVLSMAEAPRHPHMHARGTFTDTAGAANPAPAPRFDRTPAAALGESLADRRSREEALRRWGVAQAEAAPMLGPSS